MRRIFSAFISKKLSRVFLCFTYQNWRSVISFNWKNDQWNAAHLLCFYIQIRESDSRRPPGQMQSYWTLKSTRSYLRYHTIPHDTTRYHTIPHHTTPRHAILLASQGSNRTQLHPSPTWRRYMRRWGSRSARRPCRCTTRVLP